MTETMEGPPVPLETNPELVLSERDSVLARIIGFHSVRWPTHPTEDPIWGLLRIVLAQQISTTVACRLAERLKAAYPMITTPSTDLDLDLQRLRTFGVPERRAQCCITLIQRSQQIRASVQEGQSWENALAGIKGIGPWTLAVFRIMVLRHPDVLPIGDLGLERAIENLYGKDTRVECLSEAWRPFRSVACWYLWRTLGNEQLG